MNTTHILKHIIAIIGSPYAVVALNLGVRGRIAGKFGFWMALISTVMLLLYLTSLGTMYEDQIYRYFIIPYILVWVASIMLQFFMLFSNKKFKE